VILLLVVSSFKIIRHQVQHQVLFVGLKSLKGYDSEPRVNSRVE